MAQSRPSHEQTKEKQVFLWNKVPIYNLLHLFLNVSDEFKDKTNRPSGRVSQMQDLLKSSPARSFSQGFIAKHIKIAKMFQKN